MSGGGFPLDIVLFAMIAIFLVLRLRSILGRRDGFDRSMERRSGPVPVPGMGGKAPQAPVLEGRAEPAAPSVILPDPQSPAGVTLQRMRSVDPGFDPAHFLQGAEGAFRLIVEAFARGDRATLRPLLDDPTFTRFEQAIAAREQAGETQRTELRAIDRATIEAASLDGTVADITVRFVSTQVAQTLDQTGKVVSGVDAPTELVDLWTFRRDLSRPDPAWRLVAARLG